VSVIEAEHRDEMRDLLEGLERCSAHTLSGRTQRNKIGELRLQSDQFLVKPVVLAIANYRRSFVVIEAVVLPDFVSQLLETLCSLRFVFGHETRYKRAKARQSPAFYSSVRAGSRWIGARRSVCNNGGVALPRAPI